MTLITVNFSRLYYSVFERRCRVILGNFAVSALHCHHLTVKRAILWAPERLSVSGCEIYLL